MLTKQERLKIFLERMNAAAPTSSDSEALELLSRILNKVEDEFTTIPYLPEQWMADGRMYPPQADSKRIVTSEISRYRNRNHNTFIGTNGAIKIVTVNGNNVVLDKAGRDGERIGDI